MNDMDWKRVEEWVEDKDEKALKKFARGLLRKGIGLSEVRHMAHVWEDLESFINLSVEGPEDWREQAIVRLLWDCATGGRPRSVFEGPYF